ncbi:MAG: hypothetical protein AAGC57_20545 [Pseudomonadota bacterium]
MKTIITAGLVALMALPALAEDRRATAIEDIQPVLNGQLDLGNEVTNSPAQINSNVNVASRSGKTTVEVADLIDAVTGDVMATSTSVTDQVNTGSVRAVARAGISRHLRSTNVTAAAIGNTLTIVNGVSQ